jgi:hypothetical protein
MRASIMPYNGLLVLKLKPVAFPSQELDSDNAPRWPDDGAAVVTIEKWSPPS